MGMLSCLLALSITGTKKLYRMEGLGECDFKKPQLLGSLWRRAATDGHPAGL